MIFALYLACICVIYLFQCFDVFWLRVFFTFAATIFYIISESRYGKLKDRIENLEKERKDT